MLHAVMRLRSIQNAAIYSNLYDGPRGKSSPFDIGAELVGVM